MIKSPKDLNLSRIEIREHIGKNGTFVGELCHRCMKKTNLRNTDIEWKCLCGAENRIGQFMFDKKNHHIHLPFIIPDIGPTLSEIKAATFKDNYQYYEQDF